MYDFSSFLADFNCFFFSLSHVKPFLSTVNKCKKAITIIIIINIKRFLERKRFQLTASETKRFLIKKKTGLYTTTLMHSKARHVLRHLFSSNQ